MKRKVLILDDEPAICSSLKFALQDEYSVYYTHDPEACLEIMKREDIDVLLLDLRLGSVHGQDVLREAKKVCPHLIVIIITAYGTIPSTVESMRAGAYYYLTKPVNLEELSFLVAKGIEFADLNRRLRETGGGIGEKYSRMGMVGESKAIKHVFALIEKVKDIDSNVLITGESGTGKELVARAIHYMGKRSGARFEAVNCAAIPRDLLESELFGYEKGAFTGAIHSKPGRFQMAHGGTLFLDEVGELDVTLQSKLLRVLQEREVLPLGGTVSHRIDVRIIAATNKDLKSLVDAGRFREDLFYRLNVINIDIPALRERREDIRLLVAHFIKKKARLLGKNISGISQAAYSVLDGYTFPGNVREIENIIERAVALAEGPVIDVHDLPSYLSRSDFVRSDGCLVRVEFGERLSDVEKKVIAATLERVRGSRKETSRILGISERGLRNKIARYNLAERSRRR